MGILTKNVILEVISVSVIWSVHAVETVLSTSCNMYGKYKMGSAEQVSRDDFFKLQHRDQSELADI